MSKQLAAQKRVYYTNLNVNRRTLTFLHCMLKGTATQASVGLHALSAAKAVDALKLDKLVSDCTVPMALVSTFLNCY